MRSSLILGLYGQGQATLCVEDRHARIVAAIEAREEARTLELLDEHLCHIEAGIRFDDTHPAAGALSAVVRIA